MQLPVAPRKENFFLQDFICEHPGLTIYEKMVGLMLVKHRNLGQAKRCNPSRDRLAALCSISTTQVWRSLSGLKNKNIVIEKKKKNKCSQWDFNDEIFLFGKELYLRGYLRGSIRGSDQKSEQSKNESTSKNSKLGHTKISNRKKTISNSNAPISNSNEVISNSNAEISNRKNKGGGIDHHDQMQPEAIDHHDQMHSVRIDHHDESQWKPERYFNSIQEIVEYFSPEEMSNFYPSQLVAMLKGGDA